MKSVADFDAENTLATIANTMGGTAILEAGRLSLDAGGQARLALNVCVSKRMPRDQSSRTGEPHCGSHCHDRTAAPTPPPPIALPLRHCLFNTPYSVQPMDILYADDKTVHPTAIKAHVF